MNYKDLGRLYLEHPLYEQIKTRLSETGRGNITLEGLSGSSKALLLSSLFGALPTTHFVVFPEKEDAAYFYNDLVSLLGEELVFFFPSSYKRSIQYGQTDSSNIVLRTEVMNHLASGKRKCVVVSYPE